MHLIRPHPTDEAVHDYSYTAHTGICQAPVNSDILWLSSLRIKLR